MKRSFVLSASVSLACVAAPALAQGPASQALPPLPGQYAPPPPKAQAAQPAQPVQEASQPADVAVAANPLPTPQQLYEHVRRGVVAIERNGVPMAIGTVLANDGRILTALSGLAGAEGADVRYADGTTVHAKVGHSDKSADLALLVPQTGKWVEGLSASEADPLGAELRAMLPALPSAKGMHLGPATAGVKGRVDAHARDGQALPSMLDVDLKGLPIAGAPLLDSTGSVVAVLVRACKGAAPQAQAPADSPWAAWSGQASAPAAKAATAACTPVVVGEPVSAIRDFLVKTPATAVAPSPWLGIRGESEAAGSSVKGVRVVAVAPQSPAEKSGLKPSNDVIVAVDGQPIDSPEKLAEAIAKHAAGETVKLLVFGADKFREVPVALRAAP